MKIAKNKSSAKMAAAEKKANKERTEFSLDAEALLLQYAKMHRYFSSEDAVDYIKRSGVRPHDDRAFGGVFQRAIRAGDIQIVGHLPRRKGHGAPGARLYSRG